MKTRFPIVELRKYVRQVSIRNRADADMEVFSVTNSEGFTRSSDYFSKEVFSKDVSNYKVVAPWQFAYNPSRINVGSVDYLRHSSSVLVSPLYIVFEGNTEIHSDYLLRYLKSDWGNAQIRSNTEGAVRDSLKFKGLERIKAPLPPLNDQIRITKLLDKVEGLISQRKQHLQQLDELLKSVFLEMFGDPMQNEKEWETTTIEELCTLIVDCPHTTPKYSKENTGNYCIRSSDIVDGYLDLTKTYQVNETIFKDRITRHCPQENDIVYSREGGRLGNAARIIGRKNICLGQRMMLFQVSSTNTPEFFWALLETVHFKAKLQSLIGGGAAPRVNIKDLKKLVVIKPTSELQLSFSKFVLKIDQLREQYKRHLAELETLNGALSQQAFKGELDLSRVPIPGKQPEEKLIVQAEPLHAQAAQAPIIGLPDNGNLFEVNTPSDTQAKLFKQWLEVYTGQLQNTPFSAKHFLTTAQNRLAELHPNSHIEINTSDYEHVKTWIFEALDKGILIQTLDDVGNRILLKALPE